MPVYQSDNLPPMGGGVGCVEGESSARSAALSTSRLDNRAPPRGLPLAVEGAGGDGERPRLTGAPNGVCGGCGVPFLADPPRPGCNCRPEDLPLVTLGHEWDAETEYPCSTWPYRGFGVVVQQGEDIAEEQPGAWEASEEGRPAWGLGGFPYALWARLRAQRAWATGGYPYVLWIARGGATGQALRRDEPPCFGCGEPVALVHETLGDIVTCGRCGSWRVADGAPPRPLSAWELGAEPYETFADNRLRFHAAVWVKPWGSGACAHCGHARELHGGRWYSVEGGLGSGVCCGSVECPCEAWAAEGDEPPAATWRCGCGHGRDAHQFEVKGAPCSRCACGSFTLAAAARDAFPQEPAGPESANNISKILPGVHAPETRDEMTRSPRSRAKTLSGGFFLTWSHWAHWHGGPVRGAFKALRSMFRPRGSV